MATVSNQTNAARGPVFRLNRNLNVLVCRSICFLAAGVLMAMKAHVAEEVSTHARAMHPARMTHTNGVSSPKAPEAAVVAPVSNLSPDAAWCLKYYRRLL